MVQIDSQPPVSFEELEPLTPDQRVWFARRCTLRLFPFVGANGSLDHWGEAGELYLEGIELSLLDIHTDQEARAAYASAAYSAAYANDEDAVAYAVTNAITAFDNAFLDPEDYASAAAFASSSTSLAIASAIDVKEDEIDNQRFDLERLTQGNDAAPGPAPLWKGVQPKNVSSVCHAFQSACLSVGRSDVYERYRGLLYSMEPDEAATRKRSGEWLRRWHAYEEARV